MEITIELYHNPPKPRETKIPRDLIGYFEYYIGRRKHEMPQKWEQRIRVVKHKIERLQKELGQTILIKEIDENFKNDYIAYCTKNKYAPNTQQSGFAKIKTICLNARYNGLETHPHLDKLVLKKAPVAHIYLTPEEQAAIKDLELPNDHLDNARDWLLISCSTGQRVSDFMRFVPKMVRIENDKYFLEFKQKKKPES